MVVRISGRGKLNKLYVGLEAAIIFRKRYSLKSVLRKIENIKGLKNTPSSKRYEKGTDTMIYFVLQHTVDQAMYRVSKAT